MELKEISEMLSNILPRLCFAVCTVFGINSILRLISACISYGFFDFVSDKLSDLLEHFKKPKSKKSVDSSCEWDNGFFTTENYNSNNRTDG